MARARYLYNTGSSPWDLSNVGIADGLSHIPGGNYLEITDVFSDSETSNFLQKGDLILSSEHHLLVSNVDGTNILGNGVLLIDITDIEQFFGLSYSGYSGYSGVSGSIVFGFSGVSGYSGKPGDPGTGGISGTSGYSGGKGADGLSLMFNKKPSEIPNGVITTFTFPDNYVSEKIVVMLNGVVQDPSVNYIESGANTVLFDNAPLTGDSVMAIYIKA